MTLPASNPYAPLVPFSTRKPPRARPALAAAAPTLLALALAAAAPAAARPVELLGVRQWTAPDHTRIVIDLSGPAAFRHHTREAPDRIVLEIDAARFAMPLEAIEVPGAPAIERIRFNPLAKSGRAQIVVDLGRPLSYDAFALPKLDSKPDRLVLDVRHPEAPGTARGGAPGVESTPRAPRRIGPESFGDFLVMIDPGHGGEDPGRRNPDGVREKDLALEFAKALKAEIDGRPGFRAELTRTGDYFVSLERRRRISEDKGAHLFVSLHFNAAPSTAARGTEVFFVSLEGATDRALRELEDVENSADLVGGLPPADEATSSDLAKMLVDLRQNDSVERSQRLATLLTDRVERIPGLPTRRVKQAGFAVLKSLFIPAVLVEVGFLTNQADLRYVRSKTNRAAYVKALADGVVAYCDEVEIPRIGWRIHTVARGETLSSIAAQYAMDVGALKEANGMGASEGKAGGASGKEAALREGRRLRVRGK